MAQNSYGMRRAEDHMIAKIYRLTHVLAWVSLCCLVAGTGGCSRETKSKRHLQRAEGFYRAGEYSKAEVEYLNVLRLDAQNTTAIRQLGLILFEQGRYPQASAFLGRAKSSEPSNLDIRAKVGFGALLARNLAEAREEALFILSKEPANEEGLVLLADSTEEKELAATKELLEKYRPAAEKTAGFHVAWGVLEARTNRLEAAESSFKEAVRMNSQSAMARAALGNFYVRQNRLELAEEQLKAVATVAPPRSLFAMSYADFALKQGRLDEGKKLLEAVSARAPDFIPARIRLAEVAFSRSNYDECATILKALLSSGQVNFDAQLLKARLELARGNTAEALAELQRLAGVLGKVPQVHYQLALAHQANNDASAASASLNEALNLDPNYTDAVMLRAEMNVRKGDYAPAVAALTELIRREPNLVQPHVLLAAAHAGRKDYGAASAEYEKLAEAFPKNPQYAWLLGTAQARQRNAPAARQAFERALALSSDYLPAVQGLIELDLAAGLHFDALQKVQARISQAPTNAPLQMLLAKVYLAQGDTNKAEGALLKAVGLNPEHHSAHLLLAQLYVNGKKHQEALARLQDVVKRKPDDIAAHMQSAAIQDELKNFSASEQHYQKILAVYPNSPAALNNLAYIYSEHLNQLDRAVEMAEKARTVLPRDPAAADTLGWVLYKRGDYNRSLRLLEESALMLPDNPEVLYHLGMVHYALGDEEAARNSFQKSLQQGQDYAGKSECEQRLAVLTMDGQKTDPGTVRQLEEMLSKRPADPIVLARLARIYGAIGQQEKAARAYESILKSNPNNVAAMIKVADFYFTHQKDQKRALELAQKARNVAPNDPAAAHALGRLAYHTRDYKWSLSLLEESARKLKDDPQVAFDVARAQLGNGQLPQAEASLKRAVELGHSEGAKELGGWVSKCLQPEKAGEFAAEIEAGLKSDVTLLPAMFLKGCLMQVNGDFKGAQGALEKLLAEYPSFVPANKQLAYLYIRHLGDDQRALDHALKAREALQRDPQVAKTLGLIYYKRGDLRRAAELLKESVSRNDIDPETHFYLGLVHFKSGDRAASAEALKKTLSLDGNSAFAAEAKSTLSQMQ